MTDLFCDCKLFCDEHGREFLETDDDGEPFCGECASNGFTGVVCVPSPDSCFSSSGKPNDADEFEMQFMCSKHKDQKLKFIKEANDI